MLIDVHAHFLTERAGRADWQGVNDARLAAGRHIGVTAHVASILGSWGRRSPTYFPSFDDVTHANDAMQALARAHPGLVHAYGLVNPNQGQPALDDLALRLGDGCVGVKLAASRRATDPLVDPVAEIASVAGVPVLHHVWQHRHGEWPGQEASSVGELALLALRHPRVAFISAHLAGGGDWAHALRVARGVPNLWIDLSGSGLDTGMLEQAIDAVGAGRLLWGTDLTMDTGWAKLRALETLGLTTNEVDAIRFANAQAIFPAGTFRDR